VITKLEKDKKLIIVGDSLFAEIAYEYFTHDSPYEVVAFCVEKAFRTKETLLGLPVFDYEALESKYTTSQVSVYCALVYTQFNRLRKRFYLDVKKKGYTLASYVSSKAFVWQNVELGEHNFVFEDNTIQPFVKMGNNCVLWSGNHLGHHSVIEDHCFIASHVVVSGCCSIGKHSFLGVNTTIINDITIGEDSWIGPGCVVCKNVPENSLIKPIKAKPEDVDALEYFKITP